MKNIDFENHLTDIKEIPHRILIYGSLVEITPIRTTRFNVKVTRPFYPKTGTDSSRDTPPAPQNASPNE